MLFLLRSHQQVLEDVLNKKFQVGAVSSNVYEEGLRLGTFHEGDLTILLKSSIDIPSGPIALSKDIQHYDMLRVEDAFLTVDDIDQASINSMDIGGFAKITDQKYRFLLDIAHDLNIDISNYD